MEDRKMEDQIWPQRKFGQKSEGRKWRTRKWRTNFGGKWRTGKCRTNSALFVGLHIILVKPLQLKNSNIMNCSQNSMQKVRKQFNNLWTHMYAACVQQTLSICIKNLNDLKNCLQNMQTVHKQCTNCTDAEPFGWGNGTVDACCPTLQQHLCMRRRSASVRTEQAPLWGKNGQHLIVETGYNFESGVKEHLSAWLQHLQLLPSGKNQRLAIVCCISYATIEHVAI